MAPLTNPLCIVLYSVTGQLSFKSDQHIASGGVITLKTGHSAEMFRIMHKTEFSLVKSDRAM